MTLIGLIVFLVGVIGFLGLTGSIPRLKSLPFTEAQGFPLIIVCALLAISGISLMLAGAFLR